MSRNIDRGCRLRVKCSSMTEEHRLPSLAFGRFLGSEELFSFDEFVLFF